MVRGQDLVERREGRQFTEAEFTEYKATIRERAEMQHRQKQLSGGEEGPEVGCSYL